MPELIRPGVQTGTGAAQRRPERRLRDHPDPRPGAFGVNTTEERG